MFPMILDFIYHEINARIKDIDLKANNVLLLCHMSVYFGIEDLFAKTNTFIVNNVNKDTIIPYLLESYALNDTNMQELFIKCLHNIR